MTAVTYQSLALAWHPKSNRDKPFVFFTLVILTVFLGTGVFFNTIDVPKGESRVKAVLPDRIAKFILEKPKPKPKPKAEKPKPKPKVKKPKPKPKVKRKKPKKEVKLTKKEKKARKKAEKSGLLTLSEELSDLIDTPSIDSMVGKKIRKSKKTTQVASIDTTLLTADAAEGSDGVQVEGHLSSVTGKTKLDSQQRSVARKLITERAAKDTGGAGKSTTKNLRIGNYRSEEDIAYVFDKNKSKLHSIYRRARRHNPGIKGKIVLEITILPSGKVENVVITSSELNDSKLESRIVARIKQFDFGEKNVKKVSVTYPIEFLPS